MNTWTNEQVEQASMMWRAGETAQNIATAIGKSRNAVIGKMNRIGVRRNEDQDGDATARDTVKSRVEKISPVEEPAIEETQSATEEEPYTGEDPEDEILDPDNIIEINHERRLPLMYLSNKTCRWPIGDPSTKNFWFCGRQSVNDKPYCNEHSELAFQNNPKAGIPDSSVTG